MPDRPRYRWVVLAAGAAAQTTFSALAVGLPAIAPALRSHYRLSLGQIGVVLGAVGAGMIFALLPWGLAADRLGERRVIALGLGGAGATLAAVGFSNDFALLVAGLALAGACGCAVIAGSGRAVAGWFPREERGLALGIRQTAVPVGGAIAAVGLPWLAHLGGTRLAFVALGAGCLAGAVVAAVFVRDDPVGAEAPAVSLDPGPLRDRKVWLLSVGTASYLTAQVAVLGYLVLFLHDHRGVSTHRAALLLAAINVLGGVSRIVAGRASDRLHARIRPLRVLGLASAAAMVAVAATVEAPLALLVPALLVSGVLAASWNGLAFTAAAEAASPGRSGAVLGFQQTLFAICITVTPIVFAAVVSSGSWRIAFGLSAIGPVVGAVLLTRLAETKNLYRNEARAV